MSDSKEFDQILKAAAKLIDDWGKEIEKIAKALDKTQGDDGDEDDPKADKAKDKAQDKATKEAEAASKELQKKLTTLKIPPKADPKQAIKLPDFLTKNISKNGLKIGDYGSVKPDIDFDVKKMQLKKVELTWTWEW